MTSEECLEILKEMFPNRYVEIEKAYLHHEGGIEEIVYRVFAETSSSGLIEGNSDLLEDCIKELKCKSRRRKGKNIKRIN